MPWPNPNKSIRALLVLVALTSPQIGHGDVLPTNETTGASASAAPLEQSDPTGTGQMLVDAGPERINAAGLDSGPAGLPEDTSLSIQVGGEVRPGSLTAMAGLSTAGKRPALARPDTSIPGAGNPDRQDRSPQLLLLDMTVNGTSRGTALVVMDGRGALYAESSTLTKWGVEAAFPAQLEQAGRTFHDFSSLPDVQAGVTTESMSANVRIPPQYLASTNRSLVWNTSIAPSSGTGAFMDYSLAYLDDPGLDGRQSSGLVTPSVFTPMGNLSAGLLYRSSTSQLNPPSENFVRLETTWTRDFPDKISSLRLGDALTPANGWSRSLRFGGIQLATNFATQPTLITFPQPSISGSAAVPTALDIFVNGSLRGSQEVPDGTFRIDDIPVVTGAGQIQVVTRDLLGRETLVVEDFYASQKLLRPGLSDYSLSMGALRENYALRSNDYSQMMVSAMLRRGLTSNLTVEGRFDGTGETQVAGGAANYSMTHLGVFSTALAVSRQQTTGVLWQLGHQYQGLDYRFDVRFQGTSEGFAQPGIDLPNAFPRIQSLVSTGTSLGNFGSLGMSFVDERFHDAGMDRKVVSLNFSRALPYSLSVSLSGSYIRQADSDLQASLVVMKFFGGSRSASASMQRSGDLQSLRAEYRQDVPVGPGFGYRAATYSGTNNSLEAETTWNNKYNRLQAEVRSLDGQTAWRAQADGSVAWLDGDAYASREIRDGFAVVDAGGFEGVRVYLENREMGVTDSDGRLMIPGLLPYQSNRLSIDSRDLPMTAAVTKTGQVVAPYYRSGQLVAFDVKDTRGALLRVVWPDGTPIPQGFQAQIVGQEEVYPVGSNGRLYLQGVVDHSRVMISSLGWNCTLDLAKVERHQGDIIPDLGDFVCVKDVSAQNATDSGDAG
ncbi:MAG: fimbria/pilus outer membrane usher protein [Gammaproteobacteria bacterium]|nr:fimbria/pilus outer membrane usher protein [Gammaproteobacteria bacterium]